MLVSLVEPGLPKKGFRATFVGPEDATDFTVESGCLGGAEGPRPSPGAARRRSWPPLLLAAPRSSTLCGQPGGLTVKVRSVLTACSSGKH